jgi:hypothetical protein
MSTNKAKLRVEVDVSDLEKFNKKMLTANRNLKTTGNSAEDTTIQTDRLGNSFSGIGTAAKAGAAAGKGALAGIAIAAAATGASALLARESWEKLKDSYEYMLVSIGPIGEEMWDRTERRMRSVRGEFARVTLGTRDIDEAYRRMNRSIDAANEATSALAVALGPVLQKTYGASIRSLERTAYWLSENTHQNGEFIRSNIALQSSLTDARQAMELSIDRLDSSKLSEYIQGTRELEQAQIDMSRALATSTQAREADFDAAIASIRAQDDAQAFGLGRLQTNLGLRFESVAGRATDIFEAEQARLNAAQFQFQEEFARRVEDAIETGRISYDEFSRNGISAFQGLATEVSLAFDDVNATLDTNDQRLLAGLDSFFSTQQAKNDEYLLSLLNTFQQNELVVLGFEGFLSESGRRTLQQQREQAERQAESDRQQAETRAAARQAVRDRELQAERLHAQEIQDARDSAALQETTRLKEQAEIRKRNESNLVVARIAAEQEQAALQAEQQQLAQDEYLEKLKAFETEKTRIEQEEEAKRLAFRETVASGATSALSNMYTGLLSIQKKNNDGTVKSEKQLAEERKAIAAQVAGDNLVNYGNEFLMKGAASFAALQPIKGAAFVAGGTIAVAAGKKLGAKAKSLSSGGSGAPERPDQEAPSGGPTNTTTNVFNNNFGITTNPRQVTNAISQAQSEARRRGQ